MLLIFVAWWWEMRWWCNQWTLYNVSTSNNRSRRE